MTSGFETLKVIFDEAFGGAGDSRDHSIRLQFLYYSLLVSRESPLGLLLIAMSPGPGWSHS